MNIEDSLLGPEVSSIINKPNNGTNTVTFDVILHTVEMDYTVDKIKVIETLKDYNNSISELTHIDMLIPMGDLVKAIYPFRNNLEITIIKNVGIERRMVRYKFIPTNLDEKLGSGVYRNKTMAELNQEEYATLKGQCVDRFVEALRLRNISGIYRDITPMNLLKGLLIDEASRIKINGTPVNLSITAVKPDNDRTYDHVKVPYGTKLVDLTTYLQETDYGLYNGHIGMYIEKHRKGTYFNRCDFYKTPCEEVESVFIYPLYRTNVVEEAKHKLIIYGVPNVKYSMVENTYFVDGPDLKIIASDDSKKINRADVSMMDKGAGFVVLDVNTPLHRPVDVTKDKVINTKKTNNIESYMKERSDNSIYRVVKEPTDNLYHVRSDYLKEAGGIIQLQWNFSNSKYLLPGMAVIYTYLGDDNNVIRVNGVLQSHYTVCNIPSKMCSTILNIFIESDKEEYD